MTRPALLQSALLRPALVRPALLLLAWALAATVHAPAQALYAAKGPGSYVSLGLSGTGIRSQYGQQRLLGYTLYADTNLYRRVGLEFEYRLLDRGIGHDNDTGIRQSTLLAGPKLSTHGRTLRPFAKLLAGRGHYVFPYGYAEGNYLVVAAGAGLDWRVAHSRWSVRVAEIDYQYWHRFTFGDLRPYGLSTGISLRVW